MPLHHRIWLSCLGLRGQEIMSRHQQVAVGLKITQASALQTATFELSSC